MSTGTEQVAGDRGILKSLTIEVYVPVRWTGLVRVPSDVEDSELEDLAEQVRDRVRAENFSQPDAEDVLGGDQQVTWTDALPEDEGGELAFVVDLTEESKGEAITARDIAGVVSSQSAQFASSSEVGV